MKRRAPRWGEDAKKSAVFQAFGECGKAQESGTRRSHRQPHWQPKLAPPASGRVRVARRRVVRMEIEKVVASRCGSAAVSHAGGERDGQRLQGIVR